MEPLLKYPVQAKLPHALPFRIVFEEYRRRREDDLLKATHAVLGGRADRAARQLSALISHQEFLYRQLGEANEEIEAGTRKVPLDDLLGPCQATDSLLKQILHKMDASAVCLSGGGIRCATISLGVLEGLARFSCESETGLMPKLDYLSTVSGGGYMGSWMMSWVYRQMDALGGSRLLQDTLAAVEDALSATVGKDKDTADTDLLQALAAIANNSFDLWKQNIDDPKKYLPLREELEDDRGLLETQLGRVTDTAKELVAVKTPKPMGAVRRFLVSLPMRVSGPATTASSPAAGPTAGGVDPITKLRSALAEAQTTLRAMVTTLARAAYGDVVLGLAGRANKTGGDPEPQPVRHLRSYTSFLAPDLGLTLDTFTLAAIVVRNLVVNWTMLLPVLIAAIAGLEFSAALMAYVHERGIGWLSAHIFGSPVTYGGLAILIVFLVSAAAAGLALPSHQEWFRSKPERATLRDKVRRLVLTKKVRLALATTFVFSVILGVWLLTATASSSAPTEVFWVKTGIAFFGYLALTVFISLTYTHRTAGERVSWTRYPLFVGVMGTLASACMALLNGGLLFKLQNGLFPSMIKISQVYFCCGGYLLAQDWRLFVIFGLPLTLLVVLTATMIFCALLGVFEGEDDREWWARTGGALTGLALAWMAGHALALYGQSGARAIISAAIGAALGVSSSWLGFSGATAATKDPAKTSQLSSVGKFLSKHDLILPVVGGAAILFIAMGMVWVEEKLRCSLDLWPWFKDHFKQTTLGHQVWSALAMLLAASLLALVLNWAININLFSLHGMYRMRLMRAFLGASNVFRQPDPYTLFDMRDTPRQAEMPCSEGAPMHLVNATLNLTGTKNPAWQQRKAEGFSFSPVACGGWRVGYVPTTLYAGSRGKGYRERGLTLATAMAISGAAANPNMGYQSSPVLALLMTFFNLRLGCWLPNPARPTTWVPGAAQNAAYFAKNGPSFALRPLIAEALEQTDDTYRWVELSDGGHFEDLALYEMVLRRVKHIVLVDGGSDPTFGFEDLGNAVRKIQIDLGIPIEFTAKMMMKQGTHETNHYCAIADIHYSCVDAPPAQSGATHEEKQKAKKEHQQAYDGKLVYIKACLTGDEPADIIQYARTHDSFPHETTGDQFFTESQFESYRHLGSFAIETITGTDGVGPGEASIKQFIALAQGYCTPSSHVAAAAAVPAVTTRVTPTVHA